MYWLFDSCASIQHSLMLVRAAQSVLWSLRHGPRASSAVVMGLQLPGAPPVQPSECKCYSQDRTKHSRVVQESVGATARLVIVGDGAIAKGELHQGLQPRRHSISFRSARAKLITGLEGAVSATLA